MTEILKRPSFTPGARSNRPLAPIAATPPDYDIPGAIPALLQRAAACMEKWGEFASRSDRMRKLTGQGHLSYSDFYYLRGLVEATDRRARDRAAKAKATPYIPAGDSELSDAEVVAGIRLLTHHDADHAQDANGEGWSAGDSSTGHWCYAMLSTDPAAAIAVGRTIVGKYKRQLAMAGIVG